MKNSDPGKITITKVDPKLIAILKGIKAGSYPLKPYGKEIYLFKTHIAGTPYYKAAEVADKLEKGSFLVFQREVENKYDRLAIAILDLDKNKLGYVPQTENEVISRMMDAGKTIYGVTESTEWENKYLRIIINVYLREF